MPAFNLKTILVADAITCAAVFALGVLATAFVAPLLGLPPVVIAVGGWICLASALLMAFLASQKQPNGALVNLVALGNLGWVAASFAVLAIFAPQMTWVGVAIVIVQAVVVFEFALFEWRGAKALSHPAPAFS